MTRLRSRAFGFAGGAAAPSAWTTGSAAGPAGDSDMGSFSPAVGDRSAPGHDLRGRPLPARDARRHSHPVVRRAADGESGDRGHGGAHARDPVQVPYGVL